VEDDIPKVDARLAAWVGRTLARLHDRGCHDPELTPASEWFGLFERATWNTWLGSAREQGLDWHSDLHDALPRILETSSSAPRCSSSASTTSSRRADGRRRCTSPSACEGKRRRTGVELTAVLTGGVWGALLLRPGADRAEMLNLSARRAMPLVFAILLGRWIS